MSASRAAVAAIFPGMLDCSWRTLGNVKEIQVSASDIEMRISDTQTENPYPVEIT